MSRKTLPLHLLMGVGGLGALATGLTLQALLPDWRWHHAPLHSAMEAVGGLAAIAMGIVLRQRNDGPHSALAIGFIGMGLLEQCHAMSSPGNGFILLRSLASFFGGVGFGFVWLPASQRAHLQKTWVLWAVSAGALLCGLGILTFPDRLPEMLRNGEFAPTAVAPESFAAMLFIASAGWFARAYRRSGDPEEYLFALLAFMFGLAEVMFIYSTLWDSRWWFWHLIRLTAYFLVLGYLVWRSRRMVSDLRLSLLQTRRTEDTLRQSEQHLRRALDERERVAQDLHDGIIQSLFALRLNLERCQRLVSTAPQETIAQLGAAIVDLKSVIRELRGHITGLESQIGNGRELEAALGSLVRGLEGSQDLHLVLRVDPAAADRVTAEQATHLLYIAREAISNSLQHARSHTAIVSLALREGGVRLLVEDDGVGFNPQIGERQGAGLRNMAARAKKLNAHLTVSSEPGHGTRIVFDIAAERVHA